MPDLKRTIPAALILVLSGALAVTSCRLKKDDLRMFRVIDALTGAQVIESPLKPLFRDIEEVIEGDWQYIPDLSDQDRDSWGYSSKFLVLGGSPPFPRERPRLFLENQEIPPADSGGKNGDEWRVLKTHHSVNPRQEVPVDENNRKLPVTPRGVILKRGQTMRLERILPDADIGMEIIIAKESPPPGKRSLRIRFNLGPEQDVALTDAQLYRIKARAAPGMNRIEIRNVGSSEKGGSSGDGDAVKIHRLNFKSDSDILLLSRTRKLPRSAPSGRYVFRYRTFRMPAKPEGISLSPEEARFLFTGIEQSAWPGLGRAEDPFMIKKQMRAGDYTHPVLLAYPRTELSVPLPISRPAVLEFGCGFFTKSGTAAPDFPVRFVVQAETPKGTDILFDRVLSPSGTQAAERQRVDLGPLPKEGVKLTFITEKTAGTPSRPGTAVALPYWVNPVVYPARSKDPRHIILISLDTLRPDHLGCYGYSRMTSPNIDALARQGVLFHNAYSTTSWTLPAHVSLLTGLNCLHHQVYYSHQSMHPRLVTLAELLRAGGLYCAAYTGGGYLSERYGFAKGFDVYQELSGLAVDSLQRHDEAQLQADLACRWIDRNKDKDFFLFLHTYQPHDPYANGSDSGKAFLAPSARWTQIFMKTYLKDRRHGLKFSDADRQNIVDLYDGEIKYTDEYFIKPIVDKLKETNLYDNCWLILTSDHGEEFYEHESWTHEHSLYEEAVRIPLILKLPRSEHGGAGIRELVGIIDIAPTVLERTKGSPAMENCDGRSLWPLIKGGSSGERPLLMELASFAFKVCPHLVGVRQGDHKILWNRMARNPYSSRVSADIGGEKVELYDLKNDPAERRNLAREALHRDQSGKYLGWLRSHPFGLPKAADASERVRMDKELEERLRALGYVR